MPEIYNKKNPPFGGFNFHLVIDHPVCRSINSFSVMLPTVNTLPFSSNSNRVSVSASASKPETSSKNLSPT
jgi:hypothetical protein